MEADGERGRESRRRNFIADAGGQMDRGEESGEQTGSKLFATPSTLPWVHVRLGADISQEVISQDMCAWFVDGDSMEMEVHDT